MWRPLLMLVALAAVVPAAAQAAPKPEQSWALPSIKVVIARGLMGTRDPAGFRAADPLTRGALENLAAGLAVATAPTAEPPVRVSGPVEAVPGNPEAPPTRASLPLPVPAPASPAPPRPVEAASAGAPVTIAQLDARLVQMLGLADAAAQFSRATRAAGLPVSGRYGTEVVARLLGLRPNHPALLDSLELLPSDPATRAEAAYSAAQILRLRGWEATTVRAGAAAFAVPPLTAWQKRLLATAVWLIGYPYIWGGTSEAPETLFGVSSRGGFDCSGFVWRVYKLQAYPDEGGLAGTLRARTTYEMSAEVPRAQRVPFPQLEPADVLFFGAHGPRSKPAEVDHAGIYLGNGWFIHSSANGVALASLQGWYRDRFAWARRPLGEAGLAGPSRF
jgi:cell wall-associated NlpC family hydrolase